MPLACMSVQWAPAPCQALREASQGHVEEGWSVSWKRKGGRPTLLPTTQSSVSHLHNSAQAISHRALPSSTSPPTSPPAQALGSQEWLGSRTSSSIYAKRQCLLLRHTS